MEERHGCNGKEDKDATNRRTIDILCDHQDQMGECCNRLAEYKLEHKDTEYPFYACKSHFFSYYDEAENSYILS